MAGYTIWYWLLSVNALRDVRFFAASELALSVSLVVWYTNLGINFCLYCLTGARYRGEFLKLFGCGGSTDRTFRHTPPSAVGSPTLQTVCSWMLTEEMFPFSVSQIYRLLVIHFTICFLSRNCTLHLESPGTLSVVLKIFLLRIKVEMLTTSSHVLYFWSMAYRLGTH